MDSLLIFLLNFDRLLPEAKIPEENQNEAVNNLSIAILDYLRRNTVDAADLRSIIRSKIVDIYSRNSSFRALVLYAISALDQLDKENFFKEDHNNRIHIDATTIAALALWETEKKFHLTPPLQTRLLTGFMTTRERGKDQPLTHLQKSLTDKMMNSNNALINTFKEAYKKELNSYYFLSFFSCSKINIHDENLTLTDIFNHALNNNGHRTFDVLCHLGWMNTKRELTTSNPFIVTAFNKAIEIGLENISQSKTPTNTTN